jgi:general secretion pathway protein G
MVRKLHHRHVTQSGFTLVELLIVLGILVMLFAIVGPRVLRSGKKADANLAATQIAAFKPILEHYYIDMKTYPTTEQGLNALYERPDDLPKDANWDGPYGDGSEVPLDPWKHEYQYEFPSSRSDRDFPDIWSLGSDGEEDTDDDIVNWKQEDDKESPES